MTDFEPHPGDIVRAQIGSRWVDAEVLEDRGALGAEGEHLLRIAWKPTDSAERIEVDVPARRVAPRGTTFEELVRGAIERLGAHVEAPHGQGADWAPDLVVTTPHGRFIVEAKSFPGGAAPKKVTEVERRLLAAREAHGADEAVLVVPAWDRFLVRRSARPGVSIVPLASLGDWLASRLGTPG